MRDSQRIISHTVVCGQLLGVGWTQLGSLTAQAGAPEMSTARAPAERRAMAEREKRMVKSLDGAGSWKLEAC